MYEMVVNNEFECAFVVRKVMNRTAVTRCETVHIKPFAFLWKVNFLGLVFLLHLVFNVQGILGVPAHILISSKEHFLPTTLSNNHHRHITHPIPQQVLLGLQVAITTAAVSRRLQAAQYQQLHIME
jgi:hypothetical protein